jgi:hypothetical protein
LFRPKKSFVKSIPGRLLLRLDERPEVLDGGAHLVHDDLVGLAAATRGAVDENWRTRKNYPRSQSYDR